MAAPTQTSPTSGATPGSRAVVAVVAVLVLIFVGSLFSIDVRPDPDASEVRYSNCLHTPEQASKFVFVKFSDIHCSHGVRNGEHEK